jgi:hypothetical protein
LLDLHWSVVAQTSCFREGRTSESGRATAGELGQAGAFDTDVLGELGLTDGTALEPSQDEPRERDGGGGFIEEL